MTTNFTILDGADAFSVPAIADVAQQRVWLSPEVLRDTLGWTLDENGLCHGDICIPVRDRDAIEHANGLDLEGLAAILERPLALDVEAGACALGTPSSQRREAMHGLEAPDFRLPDLEGRLHSLSEHRGKKVLLIVYASW